MTLGTDALPASTESGYVAPRAAGAAIRVAALAAKAAFAAAGIKVNQRGIR